MSKTTDNHKKKKNGLQKAPGKGDKKSGWTLMRNFSLIIVALSTILTAFGQYFIKRGLGVRIMFLSDVLNLINFNFIFGFVLYGLGAVLLIIALKHRNLSVVYPIYALGFIWVALLGYFLLGETLHAVNWAGVIIVVIGVALIGIGDNHD